MVLKECYSLKFFPESALAEVVNEETVSAVLESFNYLDAEKTDLIGFICNHAPKIFAILILSGTEHLMGHFYKCKFGDSRLPVTETSGEDAIVTNLGRLTLSDSPFKHEIWSGRTAEKARYDFIHSLQWHFLGPVFRGHTFRYNFSRDQPMPFVNESSQAKIPSNFSEVEKWQIHRDHLQIESQIVST
jgi:hypothetical protein